jgi:thioredoxin 1
VFAKVDTEAQQELARSFGIRSIPMLMIVREQVVVYVQPGAVPGEALEELVDRTLTFDMDEVHRQAEAHLATQGAS